MRPNGGSQGLFRGLERMLVPTALHGKSLKGSRFAVPGRNLTILSIKGHFLSPGEVAVDQVTAIEVLAAGSQPRSPGSGKRR